jgi:copper(I)-binding protein
MTRGRTVFIALSVALTACGGSDSGLEVTDARIGEPTGPNAALYLTITDNADVGDVLEGATTDVAESVELHETIENDDGTMGMQPVDAQLEVGPGGTESLEPGGLHLMLIDVDRLEVGDTVTVTLRWQNAGDMDVEAEVVEPQDALEHEDHG